MPACNMRFGPLMRFGPGPKRIAKGAMHFVPDRNAWQSVLCILVRTETHGKVCYAVWSGHIRITISGHANGSNLNGHICIANITMRFGPDRNAWQTVLCILVRTHMHSDFRPCRRVHFKRTHMHGSFMSCKRVYFKRTARADFVIQ